MTWERFERPKETLYDAEGNERKPALCWYCGLPTVAMQQDEVLNPKADKPTYYNGAWLWWCRRCCVGEFGTVPMDWQKAVKIQNDNPYISYMGTYAYG